MPAYAVLQIKYKEAYVGMRREHSFFESDALFAASNSSDGFKSYYDSVFDRESLRHLYIIKGGPGTGKSSFMRDVGEYFEGLGRKVAYYRCSSDPDSLDGIIIDIGIAFIDGTAPHSAEPKLIGARDDIIDLGRFWDSRILSERGGEISALCREKEAAYARAYKYLSACGSLLRIIKERANLALLEDKLRAAVLRIFDNIGRGTAVESIPALVEGIGMKGIVRYDSYERAADHIYEISDVYSSGAFFLLTVADMAKRYAQPFRISYEPIVSEYPNALYLTERKIAFVIKDKRSDRSDGRKNINMSRFLDMDMLNAQKMRYKSDIQLYQRILDVACEEFKSVAEYHFELERIYRDSMDFSSKERFTVSFCEMLRDTYLAKK